MQARMTNPAEILPDATKGIQNIYKAIGQSGTDGKILELVHLRASQINGCSPCVFGGIKSALKNGETDERLFAVPVWRETPYFTGPERAALEMAEAATRLADNPTSVSDEIWAAASEHFGEKELSAIVLMIALTNMFNRINTTVRAQAGATW